MKNKFISFLLTMVIGLIAVPTTVFASNDDFMWHIPAMTSEEAIQVSEALETIRACHESFKTLVDAMMKAKEQGIYSKEDISNVHKFYESQVSSNAQLPTDSKGLLDLLFSNKIITKTQYEQTLDILN